MSYFNLLAAGIVMSAGALCVCATDVPGLLYAALQQKFLKAAKKLLCK